MSEVAVALVIEGRGLRSTKGFLSYVEEGKVKKHEELI
jgi:hypothetical protein